jgi:hypothetical protein
MSRRSVTLCGFYLDPLFEVIVLCVGEKARLKRWTGPSQLCHWCQAWQKGARMPTGVTVRLPYFLLSTLLRVKSLGSCIDAIAQQ